MKKILALALALIMVLGLATTASAAEAEAPATPATYTITINNKLDGHTYEAYQIFVGDLDKAATDDAVSGTSAVLSNVQWGANAKQKGAVADEVLDVLTIEEAIGYVDFTTDPVAESTDKGDTYVIEGLAPGYYLIKDQDGSLTGDHDAYTSYIIEVIEDSTVDPKSAFPTVDKQVQDEVADKEENADANGWGETADHAINETFQFKLIANLPADTNFAAYETYKVVFNDTMSDGVTFESIVSVTVDGVVLTADQYDCSATAGQAGGSWKLTIEDITAISGVTLTNGAVIEVVYSAHLNENAKIANEKENKNTVNLQYSNNPNASGEGEEELGKTPDDHVWVFTYEMKNTKTTGSGAKLEGATFAIKNDEDKYYGGVVDGVVTWVESTDPVNDNAVYKVTSDVNGNFTVKGLDVGTYILEEIVTPAGYNTCADVTVVISATHAEKSATEAEAVITMTKDGEAATEIVVVNQSGATLPETGGIGTTIFYVIGGVLVIGAAVLLVTKKRMASAE